MKSAVLNIHEGCSVQIHELALNFHEKLAVLNIHETCCAQLFMKLAQLNILIQYGHETSSARCKFRVHNVHETW